MWLKIRSAAEIPAPVRKEIKMHFMIDSQPIIPPSAQNNLISPAPIIPKAKRIIRNNGITLPIIKIQFRNILLPYTDKQSHRHGKNNPSVINFCCTDIHDHGSSGNRYRKKVKNAYCITSSLIFFATVSILFIQ